MALGVCTIQGQIALMREGLFGPTWTGAQLALLVDGNPFTVNDTLASHTEATFTGYTRQAITWGPIGWDNTAPPSADVASTVVDTWTGPGDASGQVITGWAIVQASRSGSVSGSVGAPLLLAAGKLDAPVRLAVPTDLLPLVANLDLQAQGTGTTQT